MTNLNGSRFRHGAARTGAKTPEYIVWMKMRSRCNNPNSPAYKDYGGRGISVCRRWDVFENFMLDMGPRPSDNHTLDRIDNSLGYEPGNCRWATWKQQQRNRRDNRWFVVDGVKATLAEHCERTGVRYKTAHQRLSNGASIEVAICPNRPKYGSIIRNGKSCTDE